MKTHVFKHRMLILIIVSLTFLTGCQSLNQFANDIGDAVSDTIDDISNTIDEYNKKKMNPLPHQLR